MRENPWHSFEIVPGYHVAIDLADVAEVRKYTWRVVKRANGNLRFFTSILNDGAYRTVGLARLILKPNPGFHSCLVDDKRPLDYRRSNLVILDSAQRQQRHTRTGENKSSIYRGVSYIRRSKKWRAAIELDNISFNLGDFDFEVDAARAYNDAALRLFGPFAFLNTSMNDSKI